MSRSEKGTTEKSLFTTYEWRTIKDLDVWAMKVHVRRCPICTEKYIPTPQSERRCIKCNYTYAI